MLHITFVCLGNICRSPTAEGVARHRIEARGLADRVTVDSAGTGGWHVGNPPDDRATRAAAARGIALDGAARQMTAEALAGTDLVVAMDAANLACLERLAARASGDRPAPPIRLLREWDPHAEDHDRDVPDPYYGGPQGFDDVLDIVTRSVDALLDDVEAGRLR